MLSRNELFIELKPHSNDALLVLCGSLNSNLEFISKQLGVKISARGFNFKISGPQHAAQSAKLVLQNLYKQLLHKKQPTLDTQDIHLQMCSIDEQFGVEETEVVSAKNNKFRPRNDSQSMYLDIIDQNVVTFGIGPAGSGKTFVAVMAAVHALKTGLVDRLILSRPAVDAGEKLGFLPGDLAQKVDPYLRPLYDALYDQIGPEQTNDWIDRGRIEIAPLAFIRGRTFNRSFIILDEGQNATSAQIRMLLTRIGYGSKLVITGDLTQTDLPSQERSGLSEAVDILTDLDQIDAFAFNVKDVVRHPVVKDIISAYERYGTS